MDQTQPMPPPSGRIRDMLGWEPGTANGHWAKPKGIHGCKFEQFGAELDVYSLASL